jgi:hypothetical protein
MNNNVIIVDNVFPQKTNALIINLLLQQHWGFAVDSTNGYDTLMKYVFDKKNYGFYLITYIDNKDVKNTPHSIELNTFAKTITDIVTDKLGINERVNIHRFYWNMYFNNSTMIEHTDWHDDSYLTILYNLHTTDGGIEINKIFYKDIMSQAKIFHGVNLHKGIAPKEDPIRFNLNIVFEKPKNFILK